MNGVRNRLTFTSEQTHTSPFHPLNIDRSNVLRSTDSTEPRFTSSDQTHQYREEQEQQQRRRRRQVTHLFALLRESTRDTGIYTLVTGEANGERERNGRLSDWH